MYVHSMCIIIVIIVIIIISSSSTIIMIIMHIRIIMIISSRMPGCCRRARNEKRSPGDEVRYLDGEFTAISPTLISEENP